MKNVFVSILFLSILLCACAQTPEAQPTAIPKPTWTPRPKGTFIGCTYFEGEIEKGGFSFRDLNSSSDPIRYYSNGNECLNQSLEPGEYALNVWICDPEHKDCPPAGCCYMRYDEVILVIDADEVVEMDFHFYRTDQ